MLPAGSRFNYRVICPEIIPGGVGHQPKALLFLNLIVLQEVIKSFSRHNYKGHVLAVVLWRPLL